MVQPSFDQQCLWKLPGLAIHPHTSPSFGALTPRHGEMGGQSSKEKLKGARRRASLRAGELQARAINGVNS